MIKTIVRPLPTFEEDYEKYVARKEKVAEEVKAEYELALADRTKTLDELIALVSETIEVEVEDEEQEQEEIEQTETNEYIGV